MPRIVQRVAARDDLIEHFVYLAENAGLDVAERFLANAEISFNALGEQPMLGVALALRHPELIGLRKWRVKDFDNYLIFYQPRLDCVSIVRVLHGAQDWLRVLET
ncbi:type II toxin-antitoxin system RelE/ParE family toxin [Gloeobacter kilaueensis]|uniref:Plasmid stabilization system n=1 Tax=Gloeobacter kilaueensis (strain ATCC BAA-2537 / CCAP 1431/1 / ULC 316 / JS1) TaxID=1183438 RepID=U5QIC9_GLOK1|nr:type II toxin-antitoxin system RelE/ParE family toxin [Gloeobacter kilaueensis]AGY57405.1 plasmid stabilization system [Gloeobacter kilaueensis JS1]